MWTPLLRSIPYIRVLHNIIVQWNLSNPDTNGAEESVIVSEVSSFQRHARVVYTWGGKRCPVREVSSYKGIHTQILVA